MVENLVPIITIWIHGTRPTEMVPPFLKTITNSIENVLFIKSDQHLMKASEVQHHEYLYEIAKTYSHIRSSSLEDFYFFSWSGKLDPKARKESAEILVQELKKLIHDYLDRYKKQPIIDIIAHSHGGNVALLLAENKSTDFLIDHLILLGCPIQVKTKSLIAHTIFKKIYNIHSHSDWIQVLDPQGVHILSDQDTYSDFFGVLNNFFSSRHFDKEHEKLTQIHVRWDSQSDQHDPKRHLFPVWLSKRLEYAGKLRIKRGVFHIEFTLLPFVKRLPNIIDAAKKQQREIGNNDIEIMLD